MATSNPVLSTDTFYEEATAAPSSGVMTVTGASVKAVVLTALLAMSGIASWVLIERADTANGDARLYHMLFGLGAPLLGFIVAMITSFSPKASPILAPIYAVLEGLFLGAISGFFNARYEGIVAEAALLTTATLGLMATLYATRFIVVTNKLRMGIIGATMAIALMYLVAMVLRLCGVPFHYLYGSDPISIGISFIVVAVAAFNLVLDFDVIESGAKARAPKYMEWYAAFGLLVTLIWLYAEILRLLAKLRGRD